MFSSLCSRPVTPSIITQVAGRAPTVVPDSCYRSDMSSSVQHRWDLSPEEAQALQQELRRRVVADDDVGPIRFIAGVDNSYVPATATTYAGVVVLSWPELAVVERQVSRPP